MRGDIIIDLSLDYYKCKHENAFYYNQTTDDYECRTWDLVYCPDCKSFWEERTRLGKHEYPKGSFFEGIIKSK